jgi:hypothetical protein
MPIIDITFSMSSKVDLEVACETTLRSLAASKALIGLQVARMCLKDERMMKTSL